MNYPDNPRALGGSVEQLGVHLKSLQQQLQGPGLLKVQTAGMWLDEASKRPVPQMLFSEFWLEGELQQGL